MARPTSLNLAGRLVIAYISSHIAQAVLNCGAILGSNWAYLAWPDMGRDSEILRDITFLKLVPIALALPLWKSELHRKQVLFHTDNEALVSIFKRQISKSTRLMSLFRPMVLI